MLLMLSITVPVSLSRHGGQRDVDGHLVAIEVGVEGRTYQRMELDGAAFDQHRLEGLDAQTVKGGRARSNITGRSLITSSRMCQTSGDERSTMRLRP